jgi:hypothetical protein
VISELDTNQNQFLFWAMVETEVFDGLDNAYQNECIGVLVFGSQSMQEDVARECRRSCSHCLRPPVLASKNGNVFHYHAGSAQF